VVISWLDTILHGVNFNSQSSLSNRHQLTQWKRKKKGSKEGRKERRKERRKREIKKKPHVNGLGVTRVKEENRRDQ